MTKASANPPRAKRAAAPVVEESAPPAPPDAAPMDLRAYASGAIAESLTRMLSFAEGVRAGGDIEPVHQMRVWSRHTRAALEVFAPLFPGREYKRVEAEIKKVADTLGAARDLDVMIELLEKRMAELPEDQQSGLRSFATRLQDKRAAVHRPVLRAVAQIEGSRAVREFIESLAASSEASSPSKRHRAHAHGASKKGRAKHG